MRSLNRSLWWLFGDKLIARTTLGAVNVWPFLFLTAGMGWLLSKLYEPWAAKISFSIVWLLHLIMFGKAASFHFSSHNGEFKGTLWTANVNKSILQMRAMLSLIADTRTVLGNRETACWIKSQLQVSEFIHKFWMPCFNWLPVLSCVFLTSYGRGLLQKHLWIK